jgi:glycosyltransferase involved in cell wall biosynthesis
MNILYLNPYRDGTGYANAGNNAMLALDKLGHNVYPVEYKLAKQVIEPPSRILELENRPVDTKIDAIVQNVLPPYMTYVPGVKNIGYTFFETTQFRASNWQYYLNLMDEVWVSCPENEAAAKASGVTKPIRVVKMYQNRDVYNKQYPPVNLGLQNRFAFYFIGDYSAKKNVDNLLKTYYRYFTVYDNVVLVLKTYVSGVPTERSYDLIRSRIEEIKQSLRMGKGNLYPPVVLIPSYLSDDELYSIHQQCDCFVSAERGAAWNIPAFDAMGFGNQVIVNSWGGQTQFVNGAGTYKIPATKVPVDGMHNCPFAGMFTSRGEYWYEPDYEDLGRSMIMASTFRHAKDLLKGVRQELLADFNLESLNADKDVFFGSPTN